MAVEPRASSGPGIARRMPITAQFVAVGVIVIGYFGAYMYSDHLFTNRIKGETVGIVEAMRLKNDALEIEWFAHEAWETSGAQRRRLLAQAEAEVREIDGTLAGLSQGRPASGAPAIECPRARAVYENLAATWKGGLRPRIVEILKDPAKQHVKLDGATEEFRLLADGLAKCLSEDHEDEILSRRRAGGLWIGGLSAIAVFLIWLMRGQVVKPLRLLRETARNIENGDFGTRVRVKGGGEIGVLAEGFNSMAGSLEKAFGDNKKLIRNLTSLNSSLKALLSELDVRVLLKKTVESARFLIDAQYAAIAIPRKEGGYEHFMVSGMDDALVSSIVARHGLPTGKGVFSLLLKEGKPIRIDDLSRHPAFAGVPEGHPKVSAFLGVPIILKGEIIGALHFTNRQKEGPFSQEDEDLAVSFANSAALAIKNARHMESLEELVASRTRELEDANIELKVVNKELESRRKEAEAARLLAEQANLAKSEFVANMSHELRTPLNSVIGFSEVMIEGMAGPLQDNQREYLRDIHESGRHLLSLINDILDLSKVESGRLSFEMSDFYMKSLIDGCVTMLREKALRHDISVKADVAEGVGMVSGDERKIKQAVVNLLSNAFKFTPDGGKVSIRVRRTPAGGEEGGSGGLVEVRVEDSGPGVRPEDLPRLFHPFEQLEDTLTKKHEGTGLGLALSKRFVEMHGGRIWAESRPGHGGIFVFVIPARTDFNQEEALK